MLANLASSLLRCRGTALILDVEGIDVVLHQVVSLQQDMLASLLSHLDLVTFQHAIQLTNVVDAIGSYVDETDGLLSWWRDLSFLNHPLVLCLLTKECGGAFRADLFELWLITARIVLERGLG